MNQRENHNFHGNTWSYTVPHRKERICFACLTETLEDDAMIMVKKRPALAEALHLIQLQNFIDDLQSNIEIAVHFTFVLIDLMESSESSFASSAVEVFLKLLSKMDSRDLLESVLDHIQKKMFHTENPKESLPLIVLLGRLVKTFPPLSGILCQEYEPILHGLINGLSLPDEDVQSNTVYLFVYLLVGPWEALVPVSMQQALAQELVCLLHTAKTPYLLRNLMALLKNLISSAELTKILMTLDLNNLTLLTSLKKLIISKDSDLQRSALYVLSCILSWDREDYCSAVINSDIIEFMFEALHCQSPDQLKFVLDCVESLCQFDLFYTKCHAVYGLESLLYALDSLLGRKNSELCRTAFSILATLLTRQPSNVPLFINASSVNSCLQLIGQGVKQHHPEVFLTSLQSLSAIIRKSYLLLPIPFEELEKILNLMINKLLKAETSLSSAIFEEKEGHKGLIENRPSDPVEIAALIYGSCIQLVEECWDDPLTCTTSYVSPDSQPKETSIQQFKDFIVNSFVVKIVPLVMRSIDKGGNPVLCRQLQKLLLSLYGTDNDRCSQVLLQLTSEGLLSTVINRRAHVAEMVEVEDQFLLQLCHVLHEEDTPEIPFPAWVDNAIHKLKHSLQDSIHLTSEDTRNLYVFLIYHMCKLDDIPLTGEEILEIINNCVGSMYNPTQFSPLTKKQLVFLWAFAVSLLQNNVDKKSPAGDLVLRTVCEEPAKEWYTHHTAFLYWVFLDSEVCHKAGPLVIDCWLSGIADSYKMDQDDFIEVLEENYHLFEMFANAEFTEAFMMTLLSVSSEVTTLSSVILRNCLEKVMEVDSSDDFILCVRAKGRQLLQDIFLREDKTLNEDHLQNTLSIFLMAFSALPASTDGRDLKLFYHVCKWLCEDTVDRHPELTEMCLRLIILFIEASDSLNNSVLPMMAQNVSLLRTFEGLLHSGDSDSVSGLTFGIISYLMDFTATQENLHSYVTITVSLHPLEKRLKSSSPIMQQCFLQVLAASFKCNFVSTVFKFSNVGRYIPDLRCPLISRDITCLFCYLQQFLVQECLKTKQAALWCLQALITYLSNTDVKLYEELHSHPWNTAMLEVMVQLTDDNPMSIATTLDMLQLVLDNNTGHTLVTESLETMLIVSKFLKELKEKSLSSHLTDQCCNLVKKFLQVVPVQCKQQFQASFQVQE
ncbi:meiosis inhibitor protein 1 isoform X1 [Magallana gigas]|uniref:meiosis inhibitor protein 1 isoform X1 n=1 Tax=Magallana gigas TaxID=29159 RepID=UPI0033408200